MSIKLINHDFLEDNDCFGCGHVNEHGLNIKVFRDSEDNTSLLGELKTLPHMTGFPGMTHGGVIYTALDCLASWTPTILLPNLPAAWVLRSAKVNYLRPMLGSQTIALSAKLKEAVPDWQPVSVWVEARDQDKKLLVSGKFKVIPLSVERFKKVSGLQNLPENWKHLLGETSD